MLGIRHVLPELVVGNVQVERVNAVCRTGRLPAASAFQAGAPMGDGRQVIAHGGGVCDFDCA